MKPQSQVEGTVQPKREKVKHLEKNMNTAGSFALWDTSLTFDYPASSGYEEFGTGNMIYYFLSPSPVEEPER
jgi:hypothetical protein